MTDNEIIKAKAHFEYGIKCDIFQEPVLSYAKTVLEAFDELSRQKAEIENYIKVAEYQQNLTPKKSFEIKELKAEIERLQKENNQFADIGKMYSEIKAEAIKEFAERLKNYYINNKRYRRPYAHTLIDFLFDIIDNLVKEMVGDTE